MTMQASNCKGNIPIFDGNRMNFPFWEQKFIAQAYKKKFHDVLFGKFKVPKFGIHYDNDKKAPNTDMSQDSTKPQCIL